MTKKVLKYVLAYTNEDDFRELGYDPHELYYHGSYMTMIDARAAAQQHLDIHWKELCDDEPDMYSGPAPQLKWHGTISDPNELGWEYHTLANMNYEED